MFKDNDNFYPTPSSLIDKMLNGIDFEKIESVLEPSCGKGDIIDKVKDKFAHVHYYNRNYNPDIDCIEIDQNLRHILKGKEYRVVHDDFLTFYTYKQYDLIIMNPPFDNGDKHLLKAIQIQENGGIVVCLLNAETIKNPYTNERKDLVRKLNEHNATIEYISDAFIGCEVERETSVEIALIKVNIPVVEKPSYIFEQLKQEERYKEEQEITDESEAIAENDLVSIYVKQYEMEVKAGINLIHEYIAMKPFILRSFPEESEENDPNELTLGMLHNRPILKLDFDDNNDRYSDKLSVNGFVERVRYKYWKALFNNPKFTGLLTGNLQNEYYNRVKELANYDFSLFNIEIIKHEMGMNLIKGVEDTILNLFDEFSHKHWYGECSKNIHYYDGWKTNKCYKINKKVIIPLQGFRDIGTSWEKYEPTDYRVIRKLGDITKVFDYLDMGRTQYIDIAQELSIAEKQDTNKKIQLKYFKITFYKKGTAHIEFTDTDILQKFNIFGSQKRGWLPPSYGKKHYSSMTREEQQAIDEFEGKESYEKVCANQDFYIFKISDIKMLESA